MTARVSSEAVAVDEANVSVPDPSVFSTSPELPSAVGKVNATPPEVITTPPVPAGVMLMSAFDPFDVISFVVTDSQQRFVEERSAIR